MTGARSTTSNNPDVLAGVPRGPLAGRRPHAGVPARHLGAPVGGPGLHRARSDLQRRPLRDRRTGRPHRVPELRQLPGTGGADLPRPARSATTCSRPASTDRSTSTATTSPTPVAWLTGTDRTSARIRRLGLRLPALRVDRRHRHHQRHPAGVHRDQVHHHRRLHPGQLEHPGQGHAQRGPPLRLAHHGGTGREDPHRAQGPAGARASAWCGIRRSRAARRSSPTTAATTSTSPSTSPTARSAARSRSSRACTTATRWSSAARAATPNTRHRRIARSSPA